jgi:DNA polymerase
VTDPDARGELGRIASALRRYVEREDARGLGESLAVSAAASSAGAHEALPDRVAEGTSGSPTMRGARPEASGPPPTPHTAAPAVDVDLFGRPVLAPGVALADELEIPDAPPVPLPTFGPALNPGGASRAAVAAASLPILEQVSAEVRDCRKCGLCETRTNTVPGVGTAASGIVFVGEAPGADEDRRGEPFVGRAGELLTRIIKAMDEASLIPGVPLSRETVYICNVLKCRPPENRNPLPPEIEQCAPYLERQLDALKPRVICCLGKFAAELLVGVKGTIASMRGRVYAYRGSKLIVTYHPAACLRNPGYKRPVWDDMQLLAREYASG